MSERTHVNNSETPIVLRESKQGPLGRGDAMKPKGFWYEVDGDWRRWCVAEDFDLPMMTHLHAVDLADCRVLLITTGRELEDFNSRFGVEPTRGCRNGVRWREVADQYDGIEISPYQWSKRLAVDFAWYYTWDCASGCIWRPRRSTVKHLRAIEPSDLRLETSEAEACP